MGHLKACLEMARREGVDDVVVHAFLDGRDTPPAQRRRATWPRSSEHMTDDRAWGGSARSCGRYYAMDRDNRWERVTLAYDALVYGAGAQAPDAQSAVAAAAYERGETDEFVRPTVIGAATSIACATATSACSSTSVPTAPASSRAPSSRSRSPSSTAARTRRASTS